MSGFIQKSTLLHLRLPFSLLLMPVFCFAVGLSPSYSFFTLFLIFFILHVLVYPASNAFNSYYDRDEDSIGGLENPPPVSKELLYVALGMDALALVLATGISFYFAFGILIYGMVSKAYSYDGVRLKKYPYLSWLTIGVFQGGFILILVYQGLMGLISFQGLNAKIFWAAFLSTLMLLGSYPMTQVYQHEADARRGDMTLSRLLGIKGSFIFTSVVFGLTGLGFFLFYWKYYGLLWAFLFQFSLAPVIYYFFNWFLRVLKDEKEADFHATMRLNVISALCLNLFFIAFIFLKYYL